MTTPANLVTPMLGLGPFLDITTNQTDFTVLGALAALGLSAGVTPVDVTVIVEPGVILSASSTTAKYGFSTAGLAAGSRVYLINKGTIVGKGGTGGQGAPSGTCACSAGLPGTAGGTALNATVPTSIDNQGIIGGGGGGGGGGGAECTYIWNASAGGGGGGAGYGPGGVTNGCGVTAGRYGGTGGTGTDTLGGAGGVAGDGHTAAGGKGGDLGQAGTAGQTIDAAGGAGGAAGAAVSGNVNINWISGNDAAHVKGALT